METKYASWNVMSKKTYATAINAQRACEKLNKPFHGTHKLPGGRFVFLTPATLIVD
ncbi:hypothetical protein OE352_000526 [Salmonella bongori]|uniref:hypothetical protein n=1 Tax=Salmonella bongori TaxID=54736 RepID=UPI0013BDA79B|nr:hypothetical protein [Salmonella bongori]EDP8708189.1 hypothetical protein [Salmonella bongori]EDP8725809.1 hypothetical protein [Salmonella bongori]EEO9371565.1 hypothetical protein [Salmonella bongori]EHU5138496.1 hypothetical protein [Salmonella bongori]EIL5514451.1 hypothetical protein [Salmonella bongori]